MSLTYHCPDCGHKFILALHGLTEYQTSIDVLNLPTMTRNALFRSGIRTIEQLKAEGAHLRLHVRNLGKTGERHILEALANYEEAVEA